MVSAFTFPCQGIPIFIDRARKAIIKSFKEENLQITIETKLKVVEFLDVKFDLNTGKFSPYKKPNDSPIYIHKKSNHPPNIIKQIPVMTGRRLSNLSYNVEEFNKIAPEYEDVLRKSGFDEKLVYQPQAQKKKQRTR